MLKSVIICLFFSSLSAFDALIPINGWSPQEQAFLSTQADEYHTLCTARAVKIHDMIHAKIRGVNDITESVRTVLYRFNALIFNLYINVTPYDLNSLIREVLNEKNIIETSSLRRSLEAINSRYMRLPDPIIYVLEPEPSHQWQPDQSSIENLAPGNSDFLDGPYISWYNRRTKS